MSRSSRVAPSVQGDFSRDGTDVPVAVPITEARGDVDHRRDRRGGRGQWSMLRPYHSFVVKQERQYLEGAAQQFCACVEFRNKYDVFDEPSGDHLLHVEEESDTCMRACFSPLHEVRLVFYDVSEGADPDTVAFTAEKPFRCMHFFTCSQTCQAFVRVLDVNGEEVGSGAEPMCRASSCYKDPCAPRLEMMARDSGTFAYASGPGHGFIGGCMELCMDTTFTLSDLPNGPPIGRIAKKRPNNLKSVFAELATSGDVFAVELPQSMPEERRAIVLANTLLLDYWFFESTEMCRTRNGKTEFHFCNWHCLGCLFECKSKN